MLYVPLERKLALPPTTELLHIHLKHFWIRWWMGTPTNICIEAMWIITCEIILHAAGYYSDHSDHSDQP